MIRFQKCSLFKPFFLLSGLALFSQLALSADASTGKQYLSKRNSSFFDRKLTYEEASLNPSVYVGRVMELRGVVGGTVSGDTGGVSALLNLPTQESVMLEIPANEMSALRDTTTPEIRALVQIKDGATGNVVPLKVLAIVRESAIHTEEMTIQAKEDARQQTALRRQRENDRWQRQVKTAFRSRNSRGLTPAVPTQTGELR